MSLFDTPTRNGMTTKETELVRAALQGDWAKARALRAPIVLERLSDEEKREWLTAIENLAAAAQALKEIRQRHCGGSGSDSGDPTVEEVESALRRGASAGGSG